jgi:AAA15 family ATPase/GTPase
MNDHFLTEIEINQFKCFKDFKAAGFKRVNLIGGKNNIGKTAFMEACYINVHSEDTRAMLTAIGQIKYYRERINDNTNPLYDIAFENPFYEGLITKYNAKTNLRHNTFCILRNNFKISYIINFNSNKETVIDLNELENFDLNFSYKIMFIDNLGLSNHSLSRVYQTIQIQDKENELNVFVREFDDNIESFKVIGDKPQCKTNDEYRDITEFGDGLKHYISIICALYACENGYLFVDEIENGIHYSQLDRLWELILTLSKKTNCQVFATTHSKEMLESFARVARKLNRLVASD